jgi:mRNA interferase HicA
LKRRDLIRHLEEHGCQLLREGGNHTIYVNRVAKKTSSVPRHNEINNDLAYVPFPAARFVSIVTHTADAATCIATKAAAMAAPCESW